MRDYERFRTGLPESLEVYVRDVYRVDLSSEYGDRFIKNMWCAWIAAIAARRCDGISARGTGSVGMNT